MGSELYIYARKPNGKELVMIDWACRSSEMYQRLQHFVQIHDHNIDRVTEQDINYIKSKLQEDIAHYNREYVRLQDRKEMIKTSNSPLSEKIEFYNEIDVQASELIELTYELQDMNNFMSSLKRIMECKTEIYVGIDDNGEDIELW